MLVPKKTSKLKKILLAVSAILLILCIGFFAIFEYKARDLVHNLVGNELEIQAMSSIDSAVGEVLDEVDVQYDSLIIANFSESGSITSLQTDTSAVNKLKSELSLRITDKIRKDQKVTVGVPAGAFTGLVLLSDFGPDIKVSLTLGGSVTITIKSDFSSAGINQTLHRIYLLVSADVSLTCPIIDYDTKFETEYELCQTVIVGATPQFYGNIR
ncbi:MAG: sporulation protein YunB [Ruminococcus sp.]